MQPMKLPTSRPELARDIAADMEDQIEHAVLRAYRDGFEAALIAVNNSALGEGTEEYKAVLRGIEAAKARLEEHLDRALDGAVLVD